MTICRSCGAQNPEEAQFCQTCGGHLRSEPVVYARFLARVAAVFLDAIIVSFGSVILFGAAHIVGGLASLFLPWVYEAGMTSSKKQATLGKLAVGIIVTDERGQPISFARATGRHFAKYLSALTLGVGFVMAAFTKKKQALHDFIAGTLVVPDKRR